MLILDCYLVTVLYGTLPVAALVSRTCTAVVGLTGRKYWRGNY